MFINMFGNKSLVILLFQGCYSAFTANNFFVEPDKEVYADEGSNITLKWQFKVESWCNSPDRVREFLFGTWGHPGYVEYKILMVREHNEVGKRSGFERKVDWRGNIYDCVECNAIVKMYNLTLADFKTYGVEIEPLKRNKMPLKNWLTLIKSVPARVIKWRQRIVVQEDNATAVECKATGRPTPSVIITRNNLTLCNSTGQCVYEIPAANKYVHEGEYLCLVQQRSPRNYSLQIKRSMNLTVLELRKIPATDTAGHRINRDFASLLLMVPIFIVLLLIMGLCRFKIRLWKYLQVRNEQQLVVPRKYYDGATKPSKSLKTETDMLVMKTQQEHALDSIPREV